MNKRHLGRKILTFDFYFNYYLLWKILKFYYNHNSFTSEIVLHVILFIIIIILQYALLLTCFLIKKTNLTKFN